MTDAGPWGAYPRTILRFGRDELRIDLREQVPEAARGRLADLGLTAPFAVITACNPRGGTADPGDDAARDARFTAELATQRMHRVRAIGEAAEGGHAEAGWALVVSREAAVAIARRWDQRALFWWDGLRFSIVPVLDEGAELALPPGG